MCLSLIKHYNITKNFFIYAVWLHTTLCVMDANQDDAFLVAGHGSWQIKSNKEQSKFTLHYNVDDIAFYINLVHLQKSSIIYLSIFYTCLLLNSRSQESPSCHRSKAGRHPWQITSSSQGHKETSNNAHLLTIPSLSFKRCQICPEVVFSGLQTGVKDSMFSCNLLHFW